jgi:hypothetical protein
MKPPVKLMVDLPAVAATYIRASCGKAVFHPHFMRIFSHRHLKNQLNTAFRGSRSPKMAHLSSIWQVSAI